MINTWRADDDAAGKMWKLAEELFPIHRTLVNEGFEKSLKIIKRRLEIQILEYASGTKVWDWIIPDAWDVKDAYIKDAKGQTILDFNDNNLHLAAYSVPFSGKLSGDELFKHVLTLPDYPDAIPYATLYYRKGEWKFCMSHNQLGTLRSDEVYEVSIDVEMKPGKLRIGEYYVQGRSQREIILSSYLCHPSLANDNISGVVVTVEATRLLSRMNDLNFSYRLLIVPESIGSITYLATHEEEIGKIAGGYVLTCCGDPGPMTYKRSYAGNSVFDRAAAHVLQHKYHSDQCDIRDFWPNGSDEQKFNGPGVRLPVGSFMRTPYSEFPEYHTSKDNLNFLSREKLADTLDTLVRTLYVVDNDKTLKNRYKGEPFLSKHGIHRPIDLRNMQRRSSGYIQRILLQETDGTKSLLDVAEKWGCEFGGVLEVSRELVGAGLAEILSGDVV